jgi:hypothetical protein
MGEFMIEPVDIEYKGNTLSSGTCHFFYMAKHNQPTGVLINNQRLTSKFYFIDGHSLVLNLDVLPYPLDPGDIITVEY